MDLVNVLVTARPGWPEPVEFLITQDRMTCPAPGLNGGGDEALSVRLLVNGEAPASDSTFYTGATSRSLRIKTCCCGTSAAVAGGGRGW
ncbi:MAG: hypothetical protein R2856_27535 [Caldilineaceae bacterium]